MARARNELNEVFRVSTIGEALAELGTDPQKYESLYQLRQQRPTEYTEKVLPSLSPLERNALGLLQAGYATGAEPEEFLSRLGAYMDYEVDLNAPEGIRELVGLVPKGALGYVDPVVSSSRAVVKPQGPLGTSEANTLLHELEHVSQGKERGYLGNLLEIATGRSSGRDQELLERARQLREESPAGSAMRRSVLTAGNVFDSPRETKANISQAAQLAAVRGEDFLQTPEGEALFPTPEDRAYFYGSIMPTVPSIYPSQGTFVPEEPRVPQDKSYARRLLERLPKFQEGGEVELAQGLAPYGLRESESVSNQMPFEAKGKGFLGEILSTVGDPMTELSTTFEIGGQDVSAPLLVPGLTDQELQALQAGKEVPDSVFQKAYVHALQRIEQGKSPFADQADLRVPLAYRDGGEVGFLRFPEESRGTRGPSAEQLGTIAKQTGLVGLGFAPGAGMADYLGQFPSMEGGTEPSAVENWRQGNYGTAALQGLGAMGDMMYAVPVLGATVGSAMKGPRAAQRMLKELPARPKVSEEGFYSQVEKAVLDNPQQKGTGDQFLAQIQKTPGVKPEELQYTGLDTFLAGRPSVTKAEIQDYLDENKVQVKEVVLGGRTQKQRINDAFDEAGISNVSSPFDDFEFYDVINQRGLSADELPASLKNQLREIEATPSLSSSAPTRFESYSVPGGTNYRELYLMLPGRNEPSYQVPASHSAGPEADVNRLAQLRVNDRTVDGKPTLFVEEIQSDWHQAGRKQGYASRNQDADQQKLNNILTERQQLLAQKQDVEEQARSIYLSSRQYPPPELIEQRNALVARLNDLQTEQERLGQALQRQVPDAPFKTSWHELTLKKAINEAATKGYDQIAFTTGATQAQRYDLSKQVNSLKVERNTDGNFSLRIKRTDQDRTFEPLKSNITQQELSDYIGKDLAEKVVKDAKGASDFDKVYSGLDLQVGGEGMKGFYDTILPKSLDKIGKKYGTKVRKTTMDTPDGPIEVWAMHIPPEMRETISSQGQPLFQIGAGAAGLGTAGILSLTPGEAEARE